MFDADLSQVSHHAVIEDLVSVLCNKTQNTDRGFFQAAVAHYISIIASSMRVQIETADRGRIPVNMYTLALATSGFGKGHSTGILEDEVIAKFQKRFMTETFNIIAEQNYTKLATERHIRSGKPFDEELGNVEAEASRAGAYQFSFDSATTPAVKQLRGKLLLTTIGSINLTVDEIGSNLTNSQEVLTTYLELYDKGRLKPKLTKNTSESIRNEDAQGSTPANMLLFGTPSRLLDNGMTEDQFYTMLDTGYARRCIFGFGKEMPPSAKLDAEALYDHLADTNNDVILERWADHFYDLADPSFHDWRIEVPRDVGILLLEYKQQCEALAYVMPEHEEIKKSELKHRYFKALKLAGAFTFVDMSTTMTTGNLLSAIKLVEESGVAFQQILSRDKPYVKLAKFIVNAGTELTHVDIHEALPFVARGNGARNEMMNLATAYGYPRHMIIKKRYGDNGIEFFSGETLEETDLNKIKLSYSDHFAYNYAEEETPIPFDKLDVLTQAPGMHWANHAFVNNHREEANVIAGFNLLVLDVDEGAPLATARELLKDYTYHMYTTKRHQMVDAETGVVSGDRFRIIMPMNYVLKLDEKDYKAFMKAVLEWLPLQVDETANQRSRKWSTHKGQSFFNKGELFDCLPFIPRTSRNEEYKNQIKSLGSLSNLERWFAQRMLEGNRNNHMIRFALTLVDSGLDYLEVKNAVFGFNSKLPEPLSDKELDGTVMVTVAKRYSLV